MSSVKESWRLLGQSSHSYCPTSHALLAEMNPMLKDRFREALMGRLLGPIYRFQYERFG